MKGLELRTSTRLEKQVTFIGFGGLEVGRDWGIGKDKARPDDENAKEVLNVVLDCGIKLVDTASAYHKSEERIGNFISGRREEFFLASKCGEHNKEPGTYYDFSYKAIKASIDNSLKLLKTDVIDLMQIHFGPSAKAVLDKGETVAAMKDAQKEGKVLTLGASIDGALAERCINSGDFDAVQMDYNLLNRKNEANISLAAQKGVAVLVRTGLARGLLTPRVLEKKFWFNLFTMSKVKKLLKLVNHDMNLYMAIALNFLYDNKGITSVLLGTKKAKHVKNNLQILERDIPLEIKAKVKEIF